MSAGAAASPVKDANLSLIAAMGADVKMGYDPIPPEQYLAPILDKRCTLTPRAQILLSVIRERTIRLKPDKTRSAYAKKDNGKPFRLADCSDRMDCSASSMSRLWRELELKGYVRKDDDNKLWLNGLVRPIVADPTISDEEYISEEQAMVAEQKIRKELPGYIWRQVDSRIGIERRQVVVGIQKTLLFLDNVKADSVHATRDWSTDFLLRALAFFGIETRERKEKPATAADDRPRMVKIEVLKPVDDFTVQVFLEEAVQASKPNVYNDLNGHVQQSQPYVTKNREYRVSKSEDDSPATAQSVANLPTLEAPSNNLNPTLTSIASIAQAKSLSVESRKSTPAASPVVRTVEELFGKIQAHELRREFAELPGKFEIPAAGVQRFLIEKMEQKIGESYRITSAGALLTFAKQDLRGWIVQNRPFLTRLTEQEAREASAETVDTQTPAEKLASYRETLEILGPNHAQAQNFRDRIAELEKQLGINSAD